ncbi:hypothetical protein BCR33DRAFT_725043 [Rhizoclosmatium globosum]|uniref:Uncharacterized protein n=1 Tax=Rhizoclosmatium globosum TaxID=329046 RepID=A0A1Y2B188_9FUNG|nr:hypothetical protein BCR33DRAFT_725043 [Rhizoclosmatium globosum]|eukprot:ORY28572.1 hypothetical protein BCR33DRAFT_725043 [Rhizoclosmatium globosum]
MVVQPLAVFLHPSPSCTLSFLPSPLPQRFRPPHSYSFFYCFIRQAPSIFDAVPLSLSTFLLWPIVACQFIITPPTSVYNFFITPPIYSHFSLWSAGWC